MIIVITFISNSIINNQFVLLFEEDQKLNFFKNNIMRKFDIYRKTLDPIEVKKDISRFNNLSEKELTIIKSGDILIILSVQLIIFL